MVMVKVINILHWDVKDVNKAIYN